MKIIRRLEIGTVTYRVIKKNLEKFYGKVYFDKAEIVISSSVNKQYEGGTFFHEMGEAIDGQYCLEIDHTKLSALMEILYTVLEQNKLLR